MRSGNSARSPRSEVAKLAVEYRDAKVWLVLASAATNYAVPLEMFTEIFACS